MLGIGIRVTVDSHEFARQMGLFGRDQIPYASAVALTRTAQEAQKAVRANLPKKFIIRNNWTQKGIRMQSAKKQDWPDQYAVVGSVDKRMVEFEDGEVRAKPFKGTAFVYPRAIRPNKRALIPRSKQPGALLNGNPSLPYHNRRGPTGSKRKPRPFLAMLKTGEMGVFVRTGERVAQNKRARSSGRKPLGKEVLKLLYMMDPRSVHMPKREWLVKTTYNIATKKYPGHFERELLSALQTRR
jgi:hypothetical protein